MDFDGFFLRYGDAEAVCRAIHVAQQKRIVQIFHARIEKGPRSGNIAEAP